jgi:hypothetical protein
MRRHKIVLILISIILLLGLLYFLYAHTLKNCDVPLLKHKTLKVLPPLTPQPLNKLEL